jgi:signal transduction histidine kinase
MSIDTNIPHINQHISSGGQPGAAVAYLGQLALSDATLEDLLANATNLIAEVLPAVVTSIWELEADEKHLSLRSSSGRKQQQEIDKQITVEPNSFEDFILRSPQPVLVGRFTTETRFRLPDHLLEGAVVSGVGIRIGTLKRPYGVIEVFSEQTQSFAQQDLHFLQSIANTIALFMHTKRGEAQRAIVQEDLQNQLLKAQSVIRSGQIELDGYEIKHHLVESRERERLRLAQELHDIPIQDLYGLMYQLQDLKEIVRDTEGKEILEDFNHTLHRVVDSLRSMCGELRPPSLSPFGLEVAIRDHVEKVRHQNPNMEIHLDLMRDQQVLSDSLRLCLFRIYQQAIRNVVRHAAATDVHIRFRWDEHVILLEVEDNGHGFEVPKQWLDLVRQEHFGLVRVAEQVESVHGKLEISSAPGDGTLLRVIIPRR